MAQLKFENIRNYNVSGPNQSVSTLQIDLTNFMKYRLYKIDIINNK